MGHRFTAPEALSADLVHILTTESILIRESMRAIKRIHQKQGIERRSMVTMKRDLYEDLIAEFDKEIDDFTNGRKSNL